MPTSVKQLRCFIGMINFYRRFIPNCSTIIQPLTNLLQKKNRNISLETDTLPAFNATKTTLVNFTKLHYIKDDPQTHLTLTTDASDATLNANLLHSFQSSFHQHREGTAPFHESCWPYTWQSNISDTC